MDKDNLEVFNTVRGLSINLRNKHHLHRAAANPTVYQKEIRTYKVNEYTTIDFLDNLSNESWESTFNTENVDLMFHS
jgi:hypothetical protein